MSECESSSYDLVKSSRTIKSFLKRILPATSEAWKCGKRDPLYAVYLYAVEHHLKDEKILGSQLFRCIKNAEGYPLANSIVARARVSDAELLGIECYDELDPDYILIGDHYEMLSWVCGNYQYDKLELVRALLKIINESDVPSKQILLELKLVVAYLG